MKNTLEPKAKGKPVVCVDKSLNKYSRVILFPEKVKKARSAFKEFGLPDLKKNE